MYLRKTSRKNKDGTKVTYYQLAHNEWDPETKSSKARVIYNFGREENLDRAVLERLVSSVSRILSPEQAHRAQEEIGEAAGFIFKSCKKMGGSWFLDQLWKQLELDKILEKLFENRNHQLNMERLIFSMVANRALSPSSKLAMEDWVEKEAYIPGLNEVSSQHLYRAMDELLAVQKELEFQVFCSASNLLNLEVDLLYFDTTSSYFEVEPSEAPDDDEFRKRGFSKDKRPDLLQVVIGLAVTKEGIPIRCWVWPGNTMDMSVIEEVKNDLVGWKLGRVINVVDRGFSSQDNLVYLQRAGGHYIAGEKMRSGKKEVEEAMSQKGRYQEIKDNLHVKESVVGDGEKRKRYVIVYNPAEAEKDKKQRQEIIQKLESELESIKQQPEENHTKAVCSLRSHPVYGKYIRQLKDGTLRLNKMAIREEEKYDGKYLLITSDDTLTPEEVALGYKQLVDIENAFRTLKSSLEIRPMFHRVEERIRAHVTISWLSLLLVRIAENKIGETWDRIRDELELMSLGHFSSDKGEIYQRTELTAKQKQYFSNLNISPPNKLVNVDLES